MATANPPVRFREDDNYEIELSRVREKIRTQFRSLTDRLECRERELLEELDVILASYRSYRDEVEIVKQQNEEGLTTSRSKKLQGKIIKQSEEEIKSIIYPKQPQLVNFVCESHVFLSEIDKLGKLVEMDTDECLRGQSTHGKPVTYSSTAPNSSSNRLQNIGQNSYPHDKQQQQQQEQEEACLPGYQQQQHHTGYRQEQPQEQQQQQKQEHEEVYLPRYHHHQQQQYCQTTSNTFPIDAILFFDDDKPYFEFTNFAKIGFKLDDHYWPTSEHYFQAQKFEGCPTIQREIRHLHGAREAFEFVRKLANKSLIRKDWAERKEEIMYKALKAKFSQNNDLRDKLLQTKDRMLVEDSPYDPYWGIGSDRKGKNRLGELLMKLRTELRTTSPHASYNTSSTCTTTQTTQKSSSSLSLLNTSLSSITIYDKIIYDVNDRSHFLSNCYPAKFMLDGKDWPTVLHYFIARKFDLKKPHVSKILSMKECEEVHLYSRNLKIQYDIVSYWDMDKKVIMKQGLKAKFAQNSDLREKLLKTGISKIIERSTEDEYWSQLASGSGRNLMGELLCQVRDELNTGLHATK